MTWPFENDTSTIIKKLAKADLKEHKLKTLITAIIIVIATCLMATVFSILVNDALKQSTQAPYHAMFRAVSEDTKNKLQTDNDFETVGVYKTFGNIVNSDGRTDLAYMDDSAMSFLGFELMDGNLPQSNTEVLVSETYLSIHKLVLGDSFSFEYVDTLTNELKENTFTVCGIIQNKTQEKGKQFYILTSDRFRTEYAQQYSELSLTYSTQTASTVDVLVSLNSEKADMSPDTQKDFLKSKGEAEGIKDFDIILNDRYIDGSVDLFEKANASIKRFSLSNKKPRDYLLRGKVFCGCCDHAMALRNDAWFYCRHSEVAETLPCHGVRIKMADLEQVVFETIRAQMCPALGIDSNKDKLDLQTVQQAEHEEKLRSIQDSKRHLYEQYALGEIDLETYRTRKAVYDTELVQAKNVHAVITAQTKRIKSDYEIKLKQQEIVQEVGNANMLTKALIDRLINKVYVFPGDRIEIEYATQDFLETKESEKEV